MVLLRTRSPRLRRALMMPMLIEGISNGIVGQATETLGDAVIVGFATSPRPPMRARAPPSPMPQHMTSHTGSSCTPKTQLALDAR